MMSKMCIEEIKNDNLLLKAEINDLQKDVAVLTHNLEEKVEIISDLETEIVNLKKHNGRLQRKQEKLLNENCQYHGELIQLRQQNETLMEAITRMSAMYALMLNKLGCEELNETDYWDTVEDYEDN